MICLDAKSRLRQWQTPTVLGGFESARFRWIAPVQTRKLYLPLSNFTFYAPWILGYMNMFAFVIIAVPCGWQLVYQQPINRQLQLKRRLESVYLCCAGWILRRWSSRKPRHTANDKEKAAEIEILSRVILRQRIRISSILCCAPRVARHDRPTSTSAIRITSRTFIRIFNAISPCLKVMSQSRMRTEPHSQLRMRLGYQ